MRIELPIKTTYLPAWKTYEGIRELLQNARDAEIEHDAKMEIRHRKDTNVLVIENDGCTIDQEALLFGHTTKLGRGDLAGKFGEGLKLAMLVLARDGHEIRIRNGSEVWVPKIERSEKFDAEVLVVYVEKGRADKKRVQVEVSGITEEDFKSTKDLFLFLCKLGKDERIQTRAGSLLFGERFKGRIYVKGIFVQHAHDLDHGYDLADAEIDRDRKMVDRWDLGYKLKSIWNDAISQRPKLAEKFVAMLEGGTADVQGVDEFGASYLPDAVKEIAVKKFQEAYGPDALPVASLEQSQQVEHFGKKGVVCSSKPLRAVLEQKLGSAAQNGERLAKETTKLYGWHELTSEEKHSLERALFLVSAEEPIGIADVDVADFRDEKIRGLFFRDTGRIQISKSVLSDRATTLRVLVHEAAHKAGGGDGEKDHVSNIERIWSGIVARLTAAGGVP